MLKNKKIIVGVTGGIAAYKSCDIVSKLIKLDAEVNVIMTAASVNFVSPLTFSSLSNNPVVCDMFENPVDWNIEHISLAQKADVFLIAPATANIIGKVANGIADDMLSTTIMASTAKIVFAPAMNTKMYENEILQENISKLKKRGYYFIEPDSGRLACGDIGVGKLRDTSEIVDYVVSLTCNKQDLKGKKILITAGPSVEPIDAVRYITNRSSGKMGYSIANAALDRGAEVTLISGPTTINPPNRAKFIPVLSGQDMYRAVLDNFNDQEIVIKAAAVSDYRIENPTKHKLKKKDDNLTLSLVRNPDILKELGEMKNSKILVGFAAETDDIIENAKCKVKTKNLDFIVANDINEPDAGFAVDTNIVYIIDKNEKIEKIDKTSKIDIANIILDKIVSIDIN
ncbi:MAG: bifunctional phosphopantothenoylcysteine decarboxylase/phosphopantothenate--cysteine ligase CoaBC [Alkaliphilus sp.]|nr:MAG: bifunctional phosphopantothenoylcysteine decarboxylase/phosphopantothenate--cysteine ligase CoaBC [Alkaliphilus sp.]